MKRAPLETAEILTRKLGESMAEVAPKGWVYSIMFTCLENGGYTTYATNMTDKELSLVMRNMADKLDKGESA